MTTNHLPLGPDDRPLLWALFLLVCGAMLTGMTTGCAEGPDDAVQAAVYPRSCPNGCEDLNPCTEDACAPAGCLHEPLDGVACVEPGLPSGTCWDGACVCIDAAGCDDGNPCTVDACNAGACGHEPITCEP
jgi:hypothetical protein